MMTEVFYSCLDCPEHGIKVKETLNPKYEGDVGDYCELKDKFFNKSFPMRNTPCLDVIEMGEYECPVCGNVMDIVVHGKRFSHFTCKTHGKQEPSINDNNNIKEEKTCQK